MTDDELRLILKLAEDYAHGHSVSVGASYAMAEYIRRLVAELGRERRGHAHTRSDALQWLNMATVAGAELERARPALDALRAWLSCKNLARLRGRQGTQRLVP
jgi:hypothetical protein